MSEREEYTAETYPSFGKKYNGEKAIISLTSWKARINTVSKTLFSLLKQCPGFHIVLVLSEEEFPKMMDELPDNLKIFAENELIEVLWVYKNYKSFKKVLFTMDKYRDVPIISADDDCIYKYNYAEELYKRWLNNKNCVITETTTEFNKDAFGYATLYPLNFLYADTNVLNCINFILKMHSVHDDCFYRFVRLSKNIKLISLHKLIKNVVFFHNTTAPVSKNNSYKLKNISQERMIKESVSRFL